MAGTFRVYRLKSLDDVDKDQLLTAVAHGLQNQDGRARSEISEVYRLLSYQQIRPLLPATTAFLTVRVRRHKPEESCE